MKVNISSLKGSIQKWMNEIRKICLWVTLTTRITFRCSEYKILQNPITVWMKIDLLQLTRALLNQILAVHCIWTSHNIWWFVHLKSLHEIFTIGRGNICLSAWNYLELLGNAFYCCYLNDNMNFSDVDENASISTLR